MQMLTLSAVYVQVVCQLSVNKSTEQVQILYEQWYTWLPRYYSYVHVRKKEWTKAKEDCTYKIQSYSL